MNINVNKNEFMWEQKFRPNTVAECILPAADKTMFQQIVNEGRVPHMVLQSNSPGTGKTTMALTLVHETDADYMFVNGADCKIDYIRNELVPFASSKTMKPGGKVIIIDEFDRKQLVDAQRHLRSFMEKYSNNCSVIITANDIDGIIKPLQSRSRVIKFGLPTQEDHVSMMKQMIQRCAAILKIEGIELETPKVLAALVKKNFPDLRKTINELDMYSKNGKIDEGILSMVMNDRDSIDDVVIALKQKDFKTLRTVAPKYCADYGSFLDKLYKTLYNEVEPASIVRLIEILGGNNKCCGLVANMEIHCMFLMCELMIELEWK